MSAPENPLADLPGETALASGVAWRTFCARLAAVGDRLRADDFPADPAALAEGLRHLSRLTVFALQSYLEFNDRDFPTLHRYDDDVVKWGGPNVDNHYQRARVDPSGRYRIYGNATGLRGLIVSTPAGDMQLGQLRVFAERSLHELHVDPDGALEILLSPAFDPHPNWIPLHPETDHILLRQYVSDWTHDPVVTFHIERLDRTREAPAAPTPTGVARSLEDAATWIERTIVHWNTYLDARRGDLPFNAISPPRPVPGGAHDIAYGAAFWSLADDEALLIEGEPPAARYWSLQLYSLAWFESLDFAHRQTSLTGHDIHLDRDGRWRVVLAAHDPNVPNWLDTEGRPRGMLSYRWVWSTTLPAPTARVVPLLGLRDSLPSDHPTVTPTERRERLAVRRAAVTRRFRS